jgi:hypothetical protein
MGVSAVAVALGGVLTIIIGGATSNRDLTMQGASTALVAVAVVIAAVYIEERRVERDWSKNY